jgi:hypothetical protein
LQVAAAEDVLEPVQVLLLEEEQVVIKVVQGYPLFLELPIR